MKRVVALKAAPAGLALSHAGDVLAAAAEDDTAVLDTAKLESGGDPLLGYLPDGPGSGAVYTAISPDDRLILTSDEQAARISVFDLAAARRKGFNRRALIGRIPTGRGPVGIVIPADRRLAYAVSEIGPASLSAGGGCPGEGGQGEAHPQGVLESISLELAAKDPARAPVAIAPAGCNPVRLAVNGGTIWVTARGSDQLLAFDAARFSRHDPGALVSRVKVGSSPVALGARPDGAQVWVGNSDRFSAGKGSSLMQVLTSPGQPPKVAGTYASGAFPRQMSWMPDGRTLIVTEFGAQAVRLVPTDAVRPPGQ